MTKTFCALCIALLPAAWWPSAARADKAAPDAALSGHAGPVLDVAFSPDGRLLASAGDDGVLKIWDVAGRKELFSVNGLRGSRSQVRFTPDGKAVVALGSDNNIAVVDAGTGKARPPIALPGLTGGPVGLDVSPDGKTLAVVGRGSLRLFDLAGGTQKAAYEVHKGYEASAVAFSADGATLATVGSDNIALLVDAATGKVVRTFALQAKGVAVALSRDGKTLFTSGNDQVLRSFDVATGEGRPLLNKGVPILTLAVSRDGKTVVLGGPGHGPSLLTIPDGTPPDATYDCDAWVKSAAISPDGKWLAGGGNGGEVCLWKVKG